MGIKINNQAGNYFHTKKRLRKGDPLSPILFNIVADMLDILINRVKQEGQNAGVVPHLIDDGLSILQYVDDTIVFMYHNLENAKNLKLLLYAFEQLSALKINFHRSEIFCFGKAQEFETQHSQLFKCMSGKFPFKYLDIPMHYKKLKNDDWKIIEQKFEKKLSSWRGKHLPVGGKLVLINFV